MLENDNLIAIGIGGFFGLVLAYAFKVNAKNTSNKLAYQIFGGDHIKFVNNIVIGLATMGFVVMAAVSTTVRDIDFVKKGPANFIGETAVASILPALVIVIAAWMREYPMNMNMFWIFLLFAVKCGILHLLFQFTGYYSYLFAGSVVL